MKRHILAAAIMAAASLPAGAVYKCVIDGRTTYSQEPCAPSAAEIDTTPARGHAAPTEADKGGARTAAVAADLADARKLRDIGFDIDATERRIASLRDQMSRDLGAIRDRKRHASNNLSGAMWEQSLSTEMQATTARYQAEISVEQSRLDALRSEQTALKQRPKP